MINLGIGNYTMKPICGTQTPVPLSYQQTFCGATEVFKNKFVQ